MKLRKKLLLIICFTIICLITIFYYAARTILLNSYLDLEKKITEQNVEVTVNFLKDNLEDMQIIVTDWAEWDDTYYFVKEYSKEYIKSNLEDSTFENLKLNVIIYIDSNDKIFFQRGYNLRIGREESYERDFAEYISSIAELTRRKSKESLTGIILLPSGPFLIAAHQITTSDKQAPPCGILIMGKILDSVEIGKLIHATRTSVSMERIDKIKTSRDIVEEYQELYKNRIILISPIDNNTVSGVTILGDIFGKPALMLKIETTRDIYKHGLIIVDYLVLTILIIGVIFGLVILKVLYNVLIKRLSNISQSLDKIDLSGDLTDHIAVEGKDELSSLSLSINAMLDKIKTSQEKLIESEEKYRTIVQEQAELISRFQPDGKITFVNEAYCHYYNKKEEELIGKTFYLSVYEEDKEKVAENIKKLNPDHPINTIEHRVVLSNGEIRWQQWTDSAVFDENNNLIEYQSVGRDITERKKIEDALKESEQKFRTLAETTATGIVIIQDKKFIYVNPSTIQITGFSEEELLNMNFWESVTPEYRDMVRERGLARIKGENVQSQYEFKIKTKDGKEKWLYASSGLMKYRGKPSIVTSFFDISELKKAEQDLKESKNSLEQMKLLYQAILRSTPNGLCALSDNYVILWSNPAMMRIFDPGQKSTYEMTGVHFSEYFIDKKQFEEYIDTAVKAVRTTGLDLREITLTRLDDTPIPCEIFLVRMDPTQTASGYVATIIDISSRKEAEKELKKTHEIYREIIENTQGIPYVLNFSKDKYEFLGKGCEAIFGIPSEEFDRAKLREMTKEEIITDEKTPSDPKENFKAFLSGKIKNYKADIRIITPSGEEKWLSDSSIPTYDNKTGKVIGAIGIMNDITDRKRSEGVIRLHAMVFDNIDETIIITDHEGNIIEVNKAFYMTYGYKREEVIGRSMNFLLDKTTEDKTATQIWRAVKTQGAWNGELLCRAKNNTTRCMHTTIKPLFDKKGSCIGNISISSDVTEKKISELERETLQELSQKLTGPMNIKEIGKIVAAASFKIFKYDAFMFDIFDEQKRILQGVYGEDTRNPGGVPEEIETVTIYVDDIEKRETFKGKAKLINRPTETKETKFYPFGFQNRKSRSLMFTPIKWQEKVVGMISVQSYTPYKYGEWELNLLQTFANQCGGAVARVKADEQIRESEERYSFAFKGANDGLWDWDLKTNKIYFAPRWKEMIGCDESEISDDINEWFGRIHPDDIARVKNDIASHLEYVSENFQSEYRMMHKDSSFRWFLSKGISVRDNKGKAYRIIGSQSDITERKVAEEQLIFDAFHDSLTSLPNRALFMDRLGRLIERVKRHPDYLFAVLFLDLDRFKVINDSLGHIVGDKLLIEISKKLKGCLRVGDTVSRLGGDEFAVLLEDLKTREDAIRIAKKLQKELSSPIKIGEHETFTSVSIGIAIGDSEYDLPENLLRDADTAMYRAKSGGRLKYEVFNKEMHVYAVETLKLETDLRMAIRRHEFKIFYEPIISLKDGNIVGFESLLFWEHPNKGLLSPSNFISFAEEAGLIVQIGDWVMYEACRQMKKWHSKLKETPPISISINVSSKQFMQPDFIEKIAEVLKETQLDPKFLKLEMTESIIMQNIESTTSMLLQLRGLDIQIDIDDFGTGYSSLSYLHSFPINSLKIDRSFIKRMNKDGESMEIVKTILTLAKNLNLKTTAEGIETVEQFEQLKELSCDFGQGYFFTRPLDAEAAENFISKMPKW